MSRGFFCAYHSYLESIELLDDAERGRLFTACLLYSSTGEAPPLSGNERFVFPAIRSQIDRDMEKHAEFQKKQSENGKKGGRPRSDGIPQETQGFLEKPKKAKESESESKSKSISESESASEKEKGFPRGRGGRQDPAPSVPESLGLSEKLLTDLFPRTYGPDAPRNPSRKAARVSSVSSSQ